MLTIPEINDMRVGVLTIPEINDVRVSVLTIPEINDVRVGVLTIALSHWQRHGTDWSGIRANDISNPVPEYQSSRFCLNVKGPSAGSSSAALASLTTYCFVASASSLSALTTARGVYESSRFCLNVRGPSAGSSSSIRASP